MEDAYMYTKTIHNEPNFSTEFYILLHLKFNNAYFLLHKSLELANKSNLERKKERIFHPYLYSCAIEYVVLIIGIEIIDFQNNPYHDRTSQKNYNVWPWTITTIFTS